ncbi:hypothetical protein CS0771_53240 [Catellatospora sp. IY07-71]|uniref:ATP-binding protein n=1 Tax=Catellatospora sp. IY07-71 TaxID=2728827 RepID=UPI001BB41203|nr:ATP-binding protein [Catellatospora sp. IY07-71]BCJ75780.1 hypothetical protein CS0771_53240 [Catellatospora sp. IY07-71]
MKAISIALPGGHRSATVAREFIGLLTRSWRLADGGGLALLTSELVSNAVLHGGGAVSLTVMLRDDHVRVEINDRSAGMPAPRQPDVDGGFGLGIVDRLARAWGVSALPDGKTVWAEYQLP